MKTTLLLWSKDRGCQLEMLLHSIKTNSSIEFDTHILYKTTSDKAEKSYKVVQSEYPEVTLHKESDFKTQTLEIIKSGHPNICLGCDDNVLYRKMPMWPKTLSKIRPGQIFSLRLGRNTTIQNYATGEKQPVLPGHIDGDYLSWPLDRINPYYNYGYVGALDFNIYNRDQYIKIASEIDFHNTNLLEGNFQNYRRQFFTMMSFSASSSVCVPLNNLSGLTTHSPDPHHTIDYLNRRFLVGQRLRLLPNQEVKGCHQLMKTYWSKNETV